MNELIKDILNTDAVQLSMILGVIALFIWAIIGAVVFLIDRTHARKFLGAEFDPSKPITDRRKNRSKP